MGYLVFGYVVSGLWLWWEFTHPAVAMEWGEDIPMKRRITEGVTKERDNVPSQTAQVGEGTTAQKPRAYIVPAKFYLRNRTRYGFRVYAANPEDAADFLYTLDCTPIIEKAK